MKNSPVVLAFAAIVVTPGPALAAAKGKAMTIPDFTKGEAIPAKARHDWLRHTM